MRRTLTTAALVLALCCPAFAGIMHTPAPAPPENAVTGEMHTPAPTTQSATGGESATGATDGLTEAMLSLLETVFALL